MSNKKYIVIGFMAVLVASILSFYASSLPDGLEFTFMTLNIPEGTHLFSLFSGYTLNEEINPLMNNALVGLLGVSFTYLATVGLFKVLKA